MSPSNNDPSFNRLMNTALRIIRRREARAEALAQQVANLTAYRDAVRQSIDVPAGETPAEVSRAMRAPVGPERVISIAHNGMLITAALHPTGRRNPEREAAVWRCIRDRAYQVREERRDYR